MVVDQASATDDSRTAYFVTDGILHLKSLIGPILSQGILAKSRA